jgi:hypothetical protein
VQIGAIDGIYIVLEGIPPAFAFRPDATTATTPGRGAWHRGRGRRLSSNIVAFSFAGGTASRCNGKRRSLEGGGDLVGARTFGFGNPFEISIPMLLQPATPMSTKAR